MDNEAIKSLPIWQQNHLNTCIEQNLFKDKKVLEVGGRTPYNVTKILGVKSWICVDPIIKENKVFDESYKYYKASILDFDKETDFDLVFSTNAFEHINGLEIAINNMYKLLKTGGKLSALMGPIWSCYKGHHIVYRKQTGELINFNNIKLEDWAHLIYSEEEMKQKLAENYNEDDTNYILNYIYHRDYLTRMFYDEYKRIIDESAFNIIEFRDWHTSKYPDEKLQKILENKYNNKNFSTVSIKMLLEK